MPSTSNSRTDPFTDAIDVAVFPNFESMDTARKWLDGSPGSKGLLWYGEFRFLGFGLWSSNGALEDKLVAYAKSQIGTEVLSVARVSRLLTDYNGYWTL